MNKLLLSLITIVGTIQIVGAQSDSLIMINGDVIIGEIKNMDRGVVTIETDYSDKDFRIEWDGIKEIYTVSYFLLTLSDGLRYNGKIVSTEPFKVKIITDESGTVETTVDDIVFLESVAKGFWSQLYAAIDVGVDITKANNFRQLSMQGNLGYLARRWLLDGTFNTLNSGQDETEDIRRTDGGVSFKYFLPKDWYPLAEVNFLSNTEQKLQLRSTSKLGIGKFVIHTNQTYWGFAIGANNNYENYSVDTIPDRKSWEGFFGTELNMFDIGDLSLLTNLTAYPSFTEAGRWRTDFKFDAKYDLPLDFYIKISVTVNYDNQPAAGSSETDYVFHTGFGWEW